MSLINKMLRDLDKRHAKSNEPGEEMPGDVRPSVRRSTKPMVYAAVGVLALGIAGGGGYWGYLRYKAKSVVVATPTVQPTPVATPIVTAASTTPSAASTVAALSTTPAEAVKATSTEPIKLADAGKEPTKETGKESPKDSTKESPKESKEAAKETAKESAKESPKESAKDKTEKPKSKLIPAEPPPPEPRSSRPGKSMPGPTRETKGEPPLADDRAISKQPRPVAQSANSLLQKAVDLVQQGRNAEARSELYTALQLDPQHVGVRKLLISLLIDTKQMAEAERIAVEGTQQVPQNREFFSLLGRLQVERGDGPSALSTLKRGLPYGNNDPEYLAFLALVLQRQDHHLEATDYFRRALRLRSEGRWLVALGISLMADRQLNEAQEAFKAARTSNLPPQLNAFAEQRLREIQQMQKQLQLADPQRQDAVPGQ